MGAFGEGAGEIGQLSEGHASMLFWGDRNGGALLESKSAQYDPNGESPKKSTAKSSAVRGGNASFTDYQPPLGSL